MIPFATTKVTVKRPTTASLYVEPHAGSVAYEVVATGVRATIGTFSRTVSATEVRRGGSEQSSQVLQLTCDIPPSRIEHLDLILDETTGIEYQVDWAFMRLGIGLDHVTAEIYRWEGLL